MKDMIQCKAENYIKEGRKKKRRNRFFSVLAVIVALCTTYAMIIPAVTWEQSSECEIPEHKHTDSCYEMVAVSGEKEPVCQEIEHIHGSECYIASENLICGLEESEEHSHSEACYEEELACLISEHTHSDSCYVESEQHEDMVPVCQCEEHEHDIDCTGDSDAGIEVSIGEESGSDDRLEEEFTDASGIGYGELPENMITKDDIETAENKQQNEASVQTVAEDGVTVTVTGNLPSGAEIVLSKVPEEELSAILEQLGASAPVFAYDISISDEEGNIWQPDELGAKVVISGLVMPENEPVEVVHIHDEGEPEPVETQQSEDSIEFTAEGFSIYIGYTVDFHYNGGSFSIGGYTGIYLSELFAELGIQSVDIRSITDVVFSDPSLVSVEREGDDWRLESLAPFNTEESLTIYYSDGKSFVIPVTDAYVDFSAMTPAQGLDDGNSYGMYNLLNSRHAAISPELSGNKLVPLKFDGNTNHRTMFYTCDFVPTDLMKCWQFEQAGETDDGTYFIKTTQGTNAGRYLSFDMNNSRIAYTNEPTDIFHVFKTTDTNGRTGYSIWRIDSSSSYKCLYQEDGYSSIRCDQQNNPANNDKVWFCLTANSNAPEPDTLDGKVCMIVNVGYYAVSNTVINVDGRSHLRNNLDTYTNQLCYTNNECPEGLCVWNFEAVNDGTDGAYYVTTEVEGIEKYLTFVYTNSTTVELTDTPTVTYVMKLPNTNEVTLFQTETVDGYRQLFNLQQSSSTSSSNHFVFWYSHNYNFTNNIARLKVLSQGNTLYSFDYDMPHTFRYVSDILADLDAYNNIPEIDSSSVISSVTVTNSTYLTTANVSGQYRAEAKKFTSDWNLSKTTPGFWIKYDNGKQVYIKTRIEDPFPLWNYPSNFADSGITIVQGTLTDLITNKEIKRSGNNNYWVKYQKDALNDETPPLYRYVVTSYYSNDPTKGTIEYNGKIYYLRIMMLNNLVEDSTSGFNTFPPIDANSKCVAWLVDENGEKVILPDVCVGNEAVSNRWGWKFGGDIKTVITNDGIVVTKQGVQSTGLTYDTNGTKLSTPTSGGSSGLYQGVLPDSNGYYVMMCPQAHDEVSVFKLSSSSTMHSLIVSKTVANADKGTDIAGEEFEFTVSYTNENDLKVTETFSLHNGERRLIMFRDGENVTVTESASSAAGYMTAYKVNGVSQATTGRSVTLTSQQTKDNATIEFINSLYMPKSLKITKNILGAETHQSFPFELTVLNSDGSVADLSTVSLPAYVSLKSGTTNVLCFSLEGGENIDLDDILPAGANLTLTETSHVGYSVTMDTDTEHYDGDSQSFVLNDDMSITVTNAAGCALPETGGIGNYLFYALGILLIAGSIMCGYIFRRKPEGRNE